MLWNDRRTGFGMTDVRPKTPLGLVSGLAATAAASQHQPTIAPKGVKKPVNLEKRTYGKS